MALSVKGSDHPLSGAASGAGGRAAIKIEPTRASKQLPRIAALPIPMLVGSCHVLASQAQQHSGAKGARQG